MLSDTVNSFVMEDPDRIYMAIESCRGAGRLGFEPDTKDYLELLKELKQIAKEVPLSDERHYLRLRWRMGGGYRSS